MGDVIAFSDRSLEWNFVRLTLARCMETGADVFLISVVDCDGRYVIFDDAPDYEAAILKAERTGFEWWLPVHDEVLS